MEPITKTLCPEDNSLNFLPNFTGNALIHFEHHVYHFADQMFDGYSNGFWDFYSLSNGGFFMQWDSNETLMVRSMNGYEFELSPEAASIVVCLFALSHISFMQWDNDTLEKVVNGFHRLRQFALEHPEGQKILALID